MGSGGEAGKEGRMRENGEGGRDERSQEGCIEATTDSFKALV